MDELLGAPLPVFIGVTLVLFGGASIMTGHALADTWRPVWQCVLYGLLLAIADRLMGSLLFTGQLLSVTGYLIDAAVLMGMALVAYRATKAHKMVNQYPWLYERAGIFGWRETTR
jgi:uncharacterized membrane protein HdeD (DUF308 family)